MPPKKSASAASAASAASGPSARSGLVLKGRWKLGQMLGEGACGQVFETTDVTGTQGEHAWVIKLTPLPAGGVVEGGKKKKLSKADEALKRNADTLYMEQLVYKNYLMGVPGVPALPLTLAYGEDQGFRFLVLQRLGQDLTRAFETAGQRFPNATLADYGRQMLAALKRLHERQLVFIDVKPENFMLGLPTIPAEARSVFMVDFGLVEKYTASAGGHKPMEGEGAAGGAAGTPLFSSLAVHEGKPPARRDDLEGLGWVLLFFARGGSLPWADASSDADCLAKKKGAGFADLCQGVPGGEHLRAFLERARALSFEATPDYDAFDRLLVQLGRAKDAAGAAGAGGRKRGGGGKDESGADGGGDGGGKKKAQTTGGASSGSAASAAAGGGGGDGGAGAAGKERGGGGRAGGAVASSSSNNKTTAAGGGGGSSPGAWLAKAAGVVGKQLLGLVVSPPHEAAKQPQRKRKVRAAAASKSGGKRGRGAGGAAGVEVVEISDSSAEEEEEEEEGEDGAEEDEKENASVCSRASAAASLALEAVAGPHKGQRFDLGTLGKAVLLGGGPGIGVGLSKDKGVQAKHARLESTGREAVHSLKLVPVGGSQVLVNRVAVGKSGRAVFVGDVVEIGAETKLILRRG